MARDCMWWCRVNLKNISKVMIHTNRCRSIDANTNNVQYKHEHSHIPTVQQSGSALCKWSIPTCNPVNLARPPLNLHNYARPLSTTNVSYGIVTNAQQMMQILSMTASQPSSSLHHVCPATYPQFGNCAEIRPFICYRRNPYIH